MFKKTWHVVLILIVFVLILLFAFKKDFGRVAGASETQYLSGYAWSSNIGWISFSSTTPVVYGVTYTPNSSTDFSNGKFSGYAWSSNIGWISFGCGQPDTNVAGGILCSGDSSAPNYPVGQVTVNSGPALINNKLVGWARACSVFQSGCSGALKDTGGWDGWISLSGQASDVSVSSYGATLDPKTGKFSGFAWGGGNITSTDGTGTNISPQVIGWIDFSGTGTGVPPVPPLAGGDNPGGVTDVSNSRGVTLCHDQLCQKPLAPPLPDFTVVCSITVSGVTPTIDSLVNPPAIIANQKVTLTTPFVVTLTATPKDTSLPTQQYIYQWQITGGIPSSGTNSSIEVSYFTTGPKTASLIATRTSDSRTASCLPTDIATNFSVSDPLPPPVTKPDFGVTFSSGLTANFTSGITAFAFPDITISVTPNADFTSVNIADPSVTISLLGIKDSQGYISVDLAGSTAALVATPLFWSSTQVTPGSTVPITGSGSATFRLKLTKNQNATVDLLLSGSYFAVIKASGGGVTHTYPVRLSIFNSSGKIIEQ